MLSATLLDSNMCVVDLQKICRCVAPTMLNFFYKKNFNIQVKKDKSVVTCADLASHHYILDAFSKLGNTLPVLSEESDKITFSIRKNWNHYWLIDPLDGTKNFVKGEEDFTINIALINQGQPVFGMIYHPIKDCVYFGGKLLKNSWKQCGQKKPRKIKTHCYKKDETLRVTMSSSMKEHELHAFSAILQKHIPKIQIIRKGSALKGCMIADGHIDLYVRNRPIFEWDIAALHAIVETSGGCIMDKQNNALSYNHHDICLKKNFYVAGNPHFPWISILSEYFNQ